MKQIKTLDNSFVLQETDIGGNVTFELGYQKGGLTYLIKNKSIKFYLVEDYFYKNVVWSANIPLVVDGIAYDASSLPFALKKIFVNKGSSGETITVDTELSSASTNPVENRVITNKIYEIDDSVSALTESVSNTYTKQETNSLLESYLTKLKANEMFANYTKIDGTTLVLNSEGIN